MRMNILVTQEAMSLFAPPRPCPECGRPLPEPFEDDYRHWEGCSVVEGERAAASAREVSSTGEGSRRE